MMTRILVPYFFIEAALGNTAIAKLEAARAERDSTIAATKTAEDALVAESGRLAHDRAELRALRRGHLGVCSVRRNWYRFFDAA